ncbi:MAG: hypothetical protein HY709_06085 [Candidatus Latescibacteria bacterium]|nr:hypothetical protein [Candidatus Latescibacterota bacterium]
MDLLKTQDVIYRVQSLQMGQQAPGRQRDERRGMFKKALQEEMGGALIDVIEDTAVQTYPSVGEIVESMAQDKSYFTYQADGHYGDEDIALLPHINIVVK